MALKGASIAYRDERLFVARFVLDINREIYRLLIPGRARRWASHTDALLVACCVTIGHTEGRPMTTTKVAHYLGIPRTTAGRRLAELIEAGAISRHGRRYYIAERRLKAVGPDDVARIIRIIDDLRSATIPGRF